MRELGATQLAEWLAELQATGAAAPVLLDVREAWERQLCTIAGSIHIPMGQIPARLHELDRNASIVCICHHGARSARVASFLEGNGYQQTINLTGGVDAWAREVDRSMATY